jgi:hypothetical protein
LEPKAMKTLPLLLTFAVSLIYAEKYFSNKDCNECHEKIYSEYNSSAHAKNYFNDELHRKIADKVDKNSYKCAVCHMPIANNLDELMSGKARPDKNNKTHKDAISCYFCHTIAFVKKSHKYNLNIKAKQAKGYKPTLYGGLENPEDSDKHSSLKNPIYAKNACLGCHSHKLNDNNITIFRAIKKNQTSKGCIKCHMPKVLGGVEKMNKRSRTHHLSHKFLGIYDREFRKGGVDINISATKDRIDIKVKNKMGHPLIIQPARAKYLKVELIRDGKTIWQNYKDSPKEDKKALFELRFRDKGGNRVIIPAKASGVESNNLDINETKTLSYKDIKLKKGDIIRATLFVRFAKEDCLKVIDLKDEKFKRAEVIKTKEYTYSP